jgi:thymidylate kinase
MNRLAGTVVVTGPDGAGKSTVAARLEQEVLAGPVLHLHHRPAVLPRRRMHQGTVTDPHAEAAYPPWRSLLKLAYLFLDYQLGWWLKVRPVRRRGGSVLLERGWWDLAVDPRRYRLAPSRWMYILGRLIPRPDLTIILVADPVLLVSRVEELPVAEIARQVRAWHRFGDGRADAIVLDATEPLGSLLTTVRQELERRTSSVPPPRREELHDDLRRWASEVLRVPQGRLSVSVLGHHDESVTYRIVVRGSAEAFVLKSFVSRAGDRQAENAVAEYEALERYHTATTGAGLIGCPEPIALRLDPEPAILTRYVEGRPIDRHLTEIRSAEETVELAERLVRALRVYHDAVGDPFGDLHAQHILYSDGSLVLLDPVSPTRGLAEVRTSPEFSELALDVGYFCYALSVNWRLLLRDPGRWVWSWRLGRGLIRAASDRPGDVVSAPPKEIRSAALTYLRTLPERKGGSVRSRILARIGSHLVARMVRPD